MQKLFLCTLLAFIGFGLIVNDASAGRFGGGRGFGMMRSKSMFNHAPRAKAYTSNARKGQSNRWRGALTGLLMGSLLTSLFMGHGFGGSLISFLMLGAALYFIVNFLRRKKQENIR